MSFYDFYQRCLFENPLSVSSATLCDRGNIHYDLCCNLETKKLLIHKAHRQSGKSSIARAWAVYNALGQSKYVVSIFCMHSRDYIEKMRTFLKINDIEFSKHGCQFTFKNGSVISIHDQYAKTPMDYMNSLSDLLIIDERNYSMGQPHNHDYTKFVRLAIFYTSSKHAWRIDDLFYGVNDIYKSNVNYTNDDSFTHEKIIKYKTLLGEDAFESEYG